MAAYYSVILISLFELPIHGRIIHLIGLAIIIIDAVGLYLRKSNNYNLIIFWYIGYIYSVFIDGFFLC